jgi:hypothetical protein
VNSDPRLPPPVLFGTKKWLDSIRLEPGSHLSRDLGVCLMEAVAAYSGERHTDHPAAVPLALQWFCWGLNDGLVWERPDLEPRIRALVPGLATIKEVLLEDVQIMAECWLDWDACEWMRLADIVHYPLGHEVVAEPGPWQRETRPVAASRCIAHAAAARRGLSSAILDQALAWSTRRSTYDGFGIEEMLQGRYASAHMASTAIAQSCAFVHYAKRGADLLRPHIQARQDSAVELLERIVALHQSPPEVTP